MSAPSCQPVIFGPHITPHCPAVPWWHVTAVRLGWQLVALIVAAAILSTISEWIRDRWEITPCATWRYRIARRWYGPHAHVTTTAEAESDDPELYVVLDWDDEDASVPSLKARKLNPDYLTYRDEDAEAFWAPVTCFAPYTVRRFRPHLIRCVLLGRAVFIPWLTLYLPLPLPAGFDSRTPAEINTAYYLDATAGWPQ